MSWERIVARPGESPLVPPWETEWHEARVEGGEVVIEADGTGLFLPLPGDGHPAVRARFEVMGLTPFAFLVSSGHVTFSFGGMQNPQNTITRQSVTLAEAGGPVGEVGRWHAVEVEVGHGRAVMRLDGRVLMEGPDANGPGVFNSVATKHWGAQRLRNLVVECETPSAAPRALPGRFDLHMVVDFGDDIYHAESFRRSTFESLFDTLKAWGVSRAYWHYTLEPNHFGDGNNIFGETMANVGDYLKLAIDLAHGRGMEFYVVLKPFDLLWSMRPDEAPRRLSPPVPYGPPPTLEQSGRVGGERVSMPGWLAGHEEALIQRCPVEMPVGDIAEVVLTREDARPLDFDPAGIGLWVSRDNRAYTPYGGPVQISAGRETRPVTRHAPRGPVETSEREDVTVIRLSGLRLSEPYFALVPPEGAGALAFCNRYFRLVEALTADGRRVPLTLGLFPGPKFSGPAEFRQRGVAFDWGEGETQGIWGQPDFVERRGALRGPRGFLAFARGKNRCLDALSAAHPVSHRLWLEVVQRSIDLGADGMDFRIRCHKSSVEWSAFGFEPGVVEAFRRRHGVDITRQEFNAESWRRLRGEQYTDFVRAASARLHQAGRRLQHHVSPGMSPPPSQPTMLHMHFDWERWLDEGLIDSITCKQLEHGTAFFERVRDAAHAHGRPMYDCPYINTWFHGGRTAWAAHLSKNIRLARVSGLDGYMVYENAAVLRSQGGVVRESRPGIGDLLRAELASARSRRFV